MKYFKLSDFDEKMFRKLSNIESEYVGKFKNDELLKPFMHFTTLTNMYHFSRRYEYPFFYKTISSIENIKEKSILDIGCGLSFMPYFLSDLAKRYVATDIQEYNNFWNTVRKNILFKKMDITSENFILQDKCDVAISISVIEHTEKSKQVQLIRNIKASLKKGGLFVFTMDVDLEGNGSGLNFDELALFSKHLKDNGFDSINDFDLSLYDDILKIEDTDDHYKLPWRIKKSNNIILKAFVKIGLIKPFKSSLAVVNGVYRLNS